MATRASVTSYAGTTGTPAATAISRAASLRAIASIASGGGPTQARPAAVTARAKAGFSDRKPYPGCTASAPASTAWATWASTSRKSPVLAVDATPRRVQVRSIRAAISPRLAMKT